MKLKLFRREKRDLTTSSIPTNWDGYGNFTGVSVTSDNALKLPVVYGAVSLTTDALSTTPIDTYRKTPDGRRVELPTPSLLETPSGDLTPVVWLSALFNSLLLRGNAYGIKDNFDDLGYPREIHLVHPDEVSVRRRAVDDPTPVYRFGQKEIPLNRVFHLPGFMLPGALEGSSPLRLFAQTIGLGVASENYVAKFHGSGGHPTAALESDNPVPNEEVAKALKARVMAQIRSGGGREPIVLGGGITWKPIQVPPQEAAWLESSRFSALQIATMVYHVPASMMGIPVEGASLTYSNREQDHINFQTLALLPWARRFEQHISRLLPGKQYVRFNMDAAVRVDLTTRYKAHAAGIGAKFLHPDEARELEDRPPLTPAQKEDLALVKPPKPSPQKIESEEEEDEDEE